MLVTDVGGLGEIVPNDKVGYVVYPEMHSIANALVDFYENDRFEEFRMNLLKEKEKFSWPKLVEAILSLIELR